MTENEQHPTSTDIFDYIKPVVDRDDWHTSISAFHKDLKSTLVSGRSAVLFLWGPPLSGKTTTLRRFLSEIADACITPPLEWGDLTENKSLDKSRKVKSSTKLQGWRVYFLMKPNSDQPNVFSLESPIVTSFPEGDRIMPGTADRGLSTLMQLAKRDSFFYKDFDFDLFSIALFAQPEMEISMRITRDMIADKPDDPDFIRMVLEEKGQDTRELSNEELRHYGQECADSDAIEGINRQTDYLISRLNEEKIIRVDMDLYRGNLDYRHKVLTQSYAPKLFDALGKPIDGEGRNIFFVGSVARAEKLKLHHLSLSETV